MKFVSRSNPGKLLQFGRRVFHITQGTDDEIIGKTIGALEDFFRSLGLPVRLSEINIGSEHFTEMAERAVASKRGKLGSYVRLSPADAEEIYRLAE